jgi:hypothetical protein
LTLTASPPQRYVAEQRKHIIPGKLVSAGHAVGSFLHDIFMLWNAIDADIQEAADHDAKEKYDDVK